MSTRDVRSLYDAYPYPSPVAGDGLISDVANMAAFLFAPGFLPGKRVLDVGCGAGHRLLGFARRFPAASFVGIDLAAAPLAVARELAAKHGIGNVEFQQADLLAWRPPERYDLIVSTGVIHHLEDPEQGLRRLCDCLTPAGSVILWLYHPYGEFDRLLRRDLVLTFWDRDRMSFQEGIEVMEALGVSLAVERYSGAHAQRDNLALDQTSVNVDAFLHPIVNAYAFDAALRLLGRCGMAWAAVHSISLAAGTRLVDLGRASTPGVAAFCVKHEDLLAADGMRQRYLGLDNRKKLRVIELMTQPNGYCIVAGSNASRDAFDRRMQGNMVQLDERA